MLEISRFISGPLAGRLLADLGADVVKVEAPAGDETRLWGAVRGGLSGSYTQQNAGKRNLCIDLGVPGAADLLVQLAVVADVVVHNFRPGVMERWGMNWDRLHAANPRLVMLAISGFGQNGLNAGRLTYAPVVHAEAGIVSRQSLFNGSKPDDLVLSAADTTTALHGMAAILAALLLRERTGSGQFIDLAMFDCMLATDDYSHHLIDDSPVVRLGGEVWDAPGGPLMLTGEFKFLWHQLSKTHRLDDPTPTGADLATKIKCRRAATSAWIMSFADRSSLIAALETAKVAWADIRTNQEVLAVPGVAERGVFTKIPDGVGGERGVVQSPYRFSDAASGVRGPAPHMGQHNHEVLGEWLGMQPAAIAELADKGVLRHTRADAG